MIDLLLSTLAAIMVGTIFWLVLKLIDVYNQTDGWVEWDGSADHPPISPEDEVLVCWRSGESGNPCRAGDFYWGHEGCDGDIIAYKVIR